MASQKRFTRPTVVFLDGDNGPSAGCVILPGGDAPERVVFEGLRGKKWGEVALRVSRKSAAVSDALARAMTVGDHHSGRHQCSARLIPLDIGEARRGRLWPRGCQTGVFLLCSIYGWGGKRQ